MAHLCKPSTCPRAFQPACSKSSVRNSHIARASRSGSEQGSKAAAGWLPVGLAAAVLCTAPFHPPAAYADPVKPEEVQLAVEEEKARQEYSLTLKENVERAELAAKRQVLENSVNQIEDVVQRKLNEEEANAEAATSKGLLDQVARIEAEAAQVEQQEAQLQLAAAKAEAELDRAELLEKAKEAEGLQQINKTAQGLLDFFAKLQAGNDQQP